MKYAFKIVAGEPGHPGGVVGIFQTKKDARSNWPQYNAYLKRVRISREVWEDLINHPHTARMI